MECVDPLNPRPQLLVSTLCLRHNTQLTSLSLSLSLSLCVCVSCPKGTIADQSACGLSSRPVSSV
ncbi:hypothetical protein GBAR_LOCUS25777 [Geodia barretti]|uniref:Uncharacterized protein n=1 Tax=Geodia barretti TaxID=519541 RepID=A0AA35TFJ4_GEOBA|nr:hypothetical protein GBAR_LOCUS25777 [Geodia barretti]